MKAKLVPVSFLTQPDTEFLQQIDALQRLLNEQAEILPAVMLGDPVLDADAAVFPQMLGEAYRRVE